MKKKDYKHVPKQIVSKYTSPVKVKFSTGEELNTIYEEHGQLIIIKKDETTDCENRGGRISRNV